jgi:protein-S-isoprenylcysteine O-methyltransferase Ste14
MSADRLRLLAFGVYLAAWVILAIVAIARGIPRRSRQAAAPTRITASALIGMLMQGTSALPITLTLKDGPLRPGTAELIATIVLAAAAVCIFCWALWSVPSNTAAHTLITGGAYSWLRHPIYLAFLAMLLATGFVASAGLALLAAVVLYLVGTELRVASEETELEEKFAAEYARYRQKTRWRYLPGLR